MYQVYQNIQDIVERTTVSWAPYAMAFSYRYSRALFRFQEFKLIVGNVDDKGSSSARPTDDRIESVFHRSFVVTQTIMFFIEQCPPQVWMFIGILYY